MARPKKKIDLSELEKVYTLQCTDREAASFLGVSERTLARRRKEKKFAEIIEAALAKGRLSVRRDLFRQAANGNVAAAIFLAKNILGYKDFISNEHSGLNGNPIQIENRTDVSKLTNEELEQLRQIAIKTNAT